MLPFAEVPVLDRILNGECEAPAPCQFNPKLSHIPEQLAYAPEHHQYPGPSDWLPPTKGRIKPPPVPGCEPLATRIAEAVDTVVRSIKPDAELLTINRLVVLLNVKSADSVGVLLALPNGMRVEVSRLIPGAYSVQTLVAVQM